MKKKLLFVIFACALAVGFVSGDISETNRWRFVHNKLIVEPEQTWTGWVLRNFKVVLPVAEVVGSAAVHASLFPVYETLFGFAVVSDLKLAVAIGGLEAAFMAATTVGLPVATICAMKHFQSRLKHEAFKNYVKDWHRFKEKTPEVLHKTFDKVSAGYDQSFEPEKYLDNAARLLVGDVIKIINDSSWLVE